MKFKTGDYVIINPQLCRGNQVYVILCVNPAWPAYRLVYRLAGAATGEINNEYADDLVRYYGYDSRVMRAIRGFS